MAPIRRYLRITRHSVLECRIFLENPADGPRWLLNATDPALPRVIEAVKPFVLPKLREENERLKGKKKKAVKDVVKEDDFDVSIFLTEIGTRHALMVKQKTVVDRQLTSSSSKKTAGGDGDPLIIREESDSDDEIQMSDIAPETRKDDDESYHHHHQDDKESSEPDGPRDKKKLGFNTVYDGYAIWGFVLCLLVERKGTAVRKSNPGHAQALMEEWISTQQEQMEDD